jgi:small subunit ribosomal protein S2e
MAEGAPPAEGGEGFRGGFGDRRGDRGRGGRGDRGRGRGRGPRRGDDEDEEWVPVTKLGRLVKENKIKSIEQIFLFSIPIKEWQITEQFLGGPDFVDEVMQITPVQKQTTAGQRTRFKCFVCVGDKNGHVGLGMKCSKEVSLAIRAGIILSKLAIVPVRRGYWGSKLGLPHTVCNTLSAKCGSVMIRLIPAAKGTGIVAGNVSKKMLQFAGIDDCYTTSRGKTRTLGNFIKATFFAMSKSYSFLDPTLWKDTKFEKAPFQEFTDFLAKETIKKVVDAE